MAAQFASSPRHALRKLQAPQHAQASLATAARRHHRSCASTQTSALVEHARENARNVKPRVVLVGWLGAKEHHFDKYVQLWRDWGHDTVAIRPPTSAILLPPRGDACAHHFAARLRQAATHNPHQPVLYHVFSNAGFLFLSTVLRLAALHPHLAWTDRQETPHSSDPHDASAEQKAASSSGGVRAAHLGRMDAVIWDSAPAPLTSHMASRGFIAAVLGQQAHGIESRHPGLVAAASLPLGCLLAFGPIASRSTQLWAAWGISLACSEGSEPTEAPPALVPFDRAALNMEGSTPSHRSAQPMDQNNARLEATASGTHSQLVRLAAAAPLCPQLALYSTADVLIPPAAIEAFMRAQGERGVRTSLHCWNDTAHCEHYRHHKEEYKNQLACFVESLNLGDDT